MNPIDAISLVLSLFFYGWLAVIVLIGVAAFAACVVVWILWMERIWLALCSKDYSHWCESDSPKGESIPGVRHRLAFVTREQEHK